MHPGLSKNKARASIVQKPQREVDANIKAWRDAELFAIEAAEAAQQSKRAAWATDAPHDLRPATANDIKVGAVIWYPAFEQTDAQLDCICRWREVEMLLHHGDQAHAFQAIGGTRHGLEGAFIEENS